MGYRAFFHTLADFPCVGTAFHLNFTVAACICSVLECSQYHTHVVIKRLYHEAAGNIVFQAKVTKHDSFNWEERGDSKTKQLSDSTNKDTGGNLQTSEIQLETKALRAEHGESVLCCELCLPFSGGNLKSIEVGHGQNDVPQPEC